MSQLNIQICPETGICSIVKGSSSKIDLMPGEAIAVKKVAGNHDAIREALADIDPTFAAGLGPEEIAQISNELR